jgi:hypothetical protein
MTALYNIGVALEFNPHELLDGDSQKLYQKETHLYHCSHAILFFYVFTDNILDKREKSVVHKRIYGVRHIK